jgi:hypothetical protein
MNYPRPIVKRKMSHRGPFTAESAEDVEREDTKGKAKCQMKIGGALKRGSCLRSEGYTGAEAL